MLWRYDSTRLWYCTHNKTEVRISDTSDLSNLLKFKWPKWAIDRVNELIKDKSISVSEAENIVSKDLDLYRQFVELSDTKENLNVST